MAIKRIPTLQAYSDTCNLIADQARRGADPEGTSWREKLSKCHTEFGARLIEEGQITEGTDAFRSGLAILNSLAKNAPDNRLLQHSLFNRIKKFAKVLVHANLPELALQTYRDANDFAKGLVKTNPDDELWLGFLALSYDRLGVLLFKLERFDEALHAFQRGLEISERSEEGEPKTGHGQQSIATSYRKIGQTLLRLGRTNEGLVAQQKGQSIRETLTEVERKNRERFDQYF